MKRIDYVIYIDGEEHYVENTRYKADDIFDNLVRIGNERFGPGHTIVMTRRETVVTSSCVRHEQITGHNYETNPTPLPECQLPELNMN